VSEYITQFDEFLNWCDENESDSIVLSRFRLGLRRDLRRELYVRDTSTLEQAYQLARDLDRPQVSFTRRTYYKDNANKTTTVKSQPILISVSFWV